MKKQLKNKMLKIIIISLVVFIILLLILFSEDIIKLQNKNSIALLENSSFETITNNPNIPKISAGMIPVKWDGSYWIITTPNDTEWYNYENGKFAHVMLNDGYYQSELIQDMTNKELAKDNIGCQVSDGKRGSIFTWIPRYAYKESGEVKYAPTELQPGGEWIIPDIFTYTVSDATKPDFSLGGVWLQKDVDTAYSSKMTEMQKEDGIYGFLAHTKPVKILAEDTKVIQKYIENVSTINSLDDISNTNRILLKIVDTQKYEPIKANIIHNKTEQKIEIRVTYTSNGIREIVDDFGNTMTLTQTDGVILVDTGNVGLAKGTYYFTVIDNKDNKKELSIQPNVDSLYKVAYISGTDNMVHWTTYNKTQETRTSAENILLNQIRLEDTSTTYSRAIKDKNSAITAIGEETRNSEDEQIYFYGRYKANENNTYSVSEDLNYSTVKYKKGYYLEGYHYLYYYYAFQLYSLNQSQGEVTLSLPKKIYNDTSFKTLYSNSSGIPTFNAYGSGDKNMPSSATSKNAFYKYVYSSTENDYYVFKRYTMTINKKTTYSRGNFIENTYGTTDKYPNNEHSGSYWYVRNNLMKKYKLYKYDQDLILKSIYDVDTKTITTIPIDISNKGNNKVKLTLSTSGSTYKTYISNDNTTWQEITDIVSGTPKELDVDGWNNLYLKIEANTSRIDNIDVAYYKD